MPLNSALLTLPRYHHSNIVPLTSLLPRNARFMTSMFRTAGETRDHAQHNVLLRHQELIIQLLEGEARDHAFYHVLLRHQKLRFQLLAAAATHCLDMLHG